MTQNTVHQSNPGNTYTTSTLRTTKGIFRVPNALRKKFRAEYNHPSVSVPCIYLQASYESKPWEAGYVWDHVPRGYKTQVSHVLPAPRLESRGSCSERMGLLRGGLQDPSSKGIFLMQLFIPGRNSGRPCAQHFVPTKCRLGATWLSCEYIYVCKCPSSSSAFQELARHYKGVS